MILILYSNDNFENRAIYSSVYLFNERTLLSGLTSFRFSKDKSWVVIIPGTSQIGFVVAGHIREVFTLLSKLPEIGDLP